VPGSTSRRKSSSSNLPEDARLAYNRMLPRMRAFKAILQQMQIKLSPANLDSIGKNHVRTFKNDLVKLAAYVQAEENKPFASLFLRSVVGLLTTLDNIIMQLNTAKMLAEDLERIDTTTPNYAPARAATYLEFQRYLIACREPLNQALELFHDFRSTI
jgi:hypothetical protein